MRERSLLTGGLTEKFSPSLSLASLNEVARISAYFVMVVWERLEVQYHTWGEEQGKDLFEGQHYNCFC